MNVKYSIQEYKICNKNLCLGWYFCSKKRLIRIVTTLHGFINISRMTTTQHIMMKFPLIHKNGTKPDDICVQGSYGAEDVNRKCR